MSYLLNKPMISSFGGGCGGGNGGGNGGSNGCLNCGRIVCNGMCHMNDIMDRERRRGR